MPPHPQFDSLDTLAKVEALATLDDELGKAHNKRSAAGRRLGITLHHWCYILHGFLLVLHIILLAMLWIHPERRVIVAFNNSVLTIGLSAFLQAFYTLYTALLVFITQRVALIGFLSRPQKLTATHDVSGAWAGLGAAIATLWEQTKIVASIRSTLLVFLYLTCVAILHVASPTIMEFQPYNEMSTITVPSNATWPDPSVNLTTLNMGAVGPLVPLMSGMTGLSTDGLINSTVYNTFSKTPQMVNASVNANTVRANCGLLPNLTYTPNVAKGAVQLSASMRDVGTVYFASGVPSNNEISFLTNQCLQCQGYALVYLVTTAMNLDGSVGNGVSVDIVWSYNSSSGQPQNTSTTAYIAACSLDVSNYDYNLQIQNGDLEPTMDQPDGPSQAWSMWAPAASELGSELQSMVLSAYELTICDNCSEDQVMNGYLMDLLGLTPSTNSAGSASLSSAPLVTLTPHHMEEAVSQMAAELIWIAGQLGEKAGGFELTASVTEVTEEVPRWRLNTNTLPVSFAFGATFILCSIVYLMLGVPSKVVKGVPSVEGATVLEMLWVGAHASSLRQRLKAIDDPSPEKLRSVGMFDVYFTRDRLEDQQGKTSEQVPLLIPGSSTPEIEGTSKHRRGTQSGLRTLPFIRSSRQLLCHFLHGLFVALHIVLLLLLIRHPEHRAIVHSLNVVSTTALKASLQLFYVLYTVILVYITQRLAVSRNMMLKQSLTSLHDLSRAWVGTGSAIVGFWQQAKVAASVRMTLAILTYYICVSVLHISSTTVMQFEVFPGSKNSTAQSSLAWPGPSANSTYDWPMLSPMVPIDQLPSLSTEGWLKNTVYDIPVVDSTSVNATVNATTIRAQCGLLPILSLGAAQQYSVNTTIPTLGSMSVPIVPPIWKDTVKFLGFGALTNASNAYSTCAECDGYLLYLVTTGVNFEDSQGDVVSFNMNWTYTSPGGTSETSLTSAHIVACSLNATTTVDVLDVHNNVLANANLPQSNATSQSWPLFSPGGITELGTEISLAISNASFYDFLFNGYLFTLMDAYTMSSLNLNLTANNASSATQSSANPSVTLSPSQFEDVVSQIAAQYIWVAGHTNGSYGPAYGYGESTVTDSIYLWRLNVNMIPVIFASVASVILAVLAFYMVGVASLPPSTISTLGVLETLWLEAHSALLHERMLEVNDPTPNNLRVAGMFDICLADDILDSEVVDREQQNDVLHDRYPQFPNLDGNLQQVSTGFSP